MQINILQSAKKETKTKNKEKRNIQKINQWKEYIAFLYVPIIIIIIQQ